MGPRLSALVALLLFSLPLLAVEPIYAKRGLAIAGYDPVAYFTSGKPVEGTAEHTHDWNGATWRFASAANRTAFVKDPNKYAPQYGGYCAFGVSRGYAVKVDPTAWKIVDGKLYLNYSKDVQTQWSEDVPGNITKGDANWPKLRTDLAG